MSTIEQVETIVAEAMEDGDEEKQEDARRLLKAFADWETIREYAKREKKRTLENVAARLAQLKEAMEVGHSNDGDRLLKLSVVESRWQDLDDARTERRDVGSAMKDQVKAAEQKIRDLIAEAKSNQLPLFSSSTIDAPPEAEDDDDEEADRGVV